MRKGAAVLAIIWCMLLFAGCESGAAKRAVKEGDTYLAQKKYEQAYDAYKTAWNENTQDKAAIRSYQVLRSYFQAKSAFESENYEKAYEIVHSGNGDFEDHVFYPEYLALTKKIDDRYALFMEAENGITTAKEYFEDGKYEQAQELVQQVLNTTLTQKQKHTAENLVKNLRTVEKGRETLENRQEEFQEQADAFSQDTAYQFLRENNARVASMIKSADLTVHTDFSGMKYYEAVLPLDAETVEVWRIYQDGTVLEAEENETGAAE